MDEPQNGGTFGLNDRLQDQPSVSLEEARRLLASYVEHYNRVRLHSAIGYMTPLDKLEGREQAIWARRYQKLDEARKRRPLRCHLAW